MNRRLLAISWDMPPMSGPRAVQVSRTLKHLVRLGWDSWVVCFAPRSDRYNPDEELAARLAAPGVTRVPVRSLEERFPFRALWRVVPPLKLLPDEKSVWIGAATRAARRVLAARRFDAVVSYAQPWSDHLVGLRIRRATGLPWVAHFSDPWTDSPYLRGGAWQRRIWARMEASVVHGADALVFVNRHAADRVMHKYPDEYRAKAHVVPHGFDPADLESIAPVPRDDRLTLVYTGRFYDEIRTPEPLLRAIASLRERRQALERELRVVFVGTPVASHRRLASALRLEAIVEFTGRRSFVESAAWIAAADVLLLIDAPADENLFLPSKLVEYIPARKPILGLTPSCGASADLIRSLGYAVVPPDDERAIAAALEDVIAATRPRRSEASPSHTVVAREYDIARTTAAFARVLDACA